MPCVVGHDPDGQAVALIGSDVEVLYEEIASLCVSAELRMKSFEFRDVHRLVHLSPRHLRLVLWITHDELVVRRAARMMPRVYHKGAVMGDPSFTSADDFFIKSSSSKVPVHIAEIPEPELFELLH